MSVKPRPAVTACRKCPLRRIDIFENKNSDQVDFIQTFKSGEIAVARGGTLYAEGGAPHDLYTVLSGWAFRYKSLADGRRQICNFALPGDFMGLQSSLTGRMEHGAEALTDLRLCVFPRQKLFSLYVAHPSLGFDLTWLAAREERFLDDNLLAVGRRTALEKTAYLIWHLYSRARELGLVADDRLDLPLTQQHFADTLGLSLVHLNRSLRRLRATGLITLEGRVITMRDEKALARLAGVAVSRRELRPLI